MAVGFQFGQAQATTDTLVRTTTENLTKQMRRDSTAVDGILANAEWCERPSGAGTSLALKTKSLRLTRTARFPASVKGKRNGWPGEKWLDIRQIAALGPIMEVRLDLCRSKGFDGVEFDNVDGYSNRTGFPLSYQDQLNYNAYLANEAHERGLSAALKNDIEQVSDLAPYFDYVINEQCFQYDECDDDQNSLVTHFIHQGKPVFNVEYELAKTRFCPQARAWGFSSMKKTLDLDGWMAPCW
jgi:hypothetical protein